MGAVRELARRVPRRRRGAIPMSDADALRGALRRTTAIRSVLGVLLVGLAALAVWRAAELSPRPVSFLAPHTTTVVVLDQSKSIYISSYRRIAAMLRKLVAANVPVGLVAFSDTAYEMIPPGAPGSELKPLLRFYTPRAAGSNVDPETLYAGNPWQDVFSGGTKISAGLDMARSILHRDHVRGGTILLASDLGTAGEDEPELARSLLQIEHDSQVHLEIVPLYPVDSDLQFVERFVPKGDFVKPADLRVSGPIEARRRLLAGTPWPLLVLGGLLLLVLAVNELSCARLQVPRPREAA